MNKLLLLLLVWLSSCATVGRYNANPPATYYANGTTWAFARVGGAPIYLVQPGTRVQVVGVRGGWYVLRRGQQLCLVGSNALSLDTGAELLYSDTPIYPPGYVGSAGDYFTPVPVGVVHDTYAGPRGGRYYYNGNGNKTYVTPQSTIDRENVQTGPRGGQYYINRNGNKTYIKH